MDKNWIFHSISKSKIDITKNYKNTLGQFLHDDDGILYYILIGVREERVY